MEDSAIMTSTKYTLDRIEKGLFVFLLKGDESKQVEIPEEQVTASLNVGDIVSFHDNGEIEVLTEETMVTIDKVKDLIEKQKNKKQ